MFDYNILCDLIHCVNILHGATALGLCYWYTSNIGAVRHHGHNTAAPEAGIHFFHPHMKPFSSFTEFVINPNGKSEVCILHEYMQRVLKVRPVYNFFECGELLQN